MKPRIDKGIFTQKELEKVSHVSLACYLGHRDLEQISMPRLSKEVCNTAVTYQPPQARKSGENS